VKIRVENGYTDGHESTLEYDIPDADVPAYILLGDLPADERKYRHRDGEEMWDYLWEWTGDGHGEDPDLGWSYKITILEAADPKLVGLSHENSGN